MSSTKPKPVRQKSDNPYRPVTATPIQPYTHTATDNTALAQTQCPAYSAAAHSKLVQSLPKLPAQQHNECALYNQCTANSNVQPVRLTELYADQLNSIDVTHTAAPLHNTEQYSPFATALNIYNALQQYSAVQAIDIQPNKLNTTNGLHCFKLYSSVADAAVSVTVNDTVYVDSNKQHILSHSRAADRVSVFVALLYKAVITVCNKPADSVTVNDVLYALTGCIVTQYSQSSNITAALDEQQQHAGSIVGVVCTIDGALHSVTKHVEPIVNTKAKKPAVKSAASKPNKAAEPTSEVPSEPVVPSIDVVNVDTQLKSTVPLSTLDNITKYTVLYAFDNTKYHKNVTDTAAQSPVAQQGTVSTAQHTTNINTANLLTQQTHATLTVHCNAAVATDECILFVEEYNTATAERTTVYTQQFVGNTHGLLIDLHKRTAASSSTTSIDNDNVAESAVKFEPTPPSTARVSAANKHRTASVVATPSHITDARHYLISVQSLYGYALQVMSNNSTFELLPFNEPWPTVQSQWYKHTYAAHAANNRFVVCKYNITVTHADTRLLALLNAYDGAIQQFVQIQLVSHTTLQSQLIEAITLHTTVQPDTYTLIVLVTPVQSVAAGMCTLRILPSAPVQCTHESVSHVSQYNTITQCSVYNDFCVLKSTVQCTAQCTAVVTITNDKFDCSDVQTYTALKANDKQLSTLSSNNTVFVPLLPTSKQQTVSLCISIDPYTLPQQFQLQRMWYNVSVKLYSSAQPVFSIDASVEIQIEQYKLEWSKRLAAGKLSRDKHLENFTPPKLITVHGYVDTAPVVPASAVQHNTADVQAQLQQFELSAKQSYDAYIQQCAELNKQRSDLVTALQQQQATIDALHTALQQPVTYVADTKPSFKASALQFDTWLTQVQSALDAVLQLQAYKTHSVLQAAHSRLSTVLHDYLTHHINAVNQVCTALTTVSDKVKPKTANAAVDYSAVANQLLSAVNRVNSQCTDMQLNNTNYTVNEAPVNHQLSLTSEPLTNLFANAYNTCIQYYTQLITHFVTQNNESTVDRLMEHLQHTTTQFTLTAEQQATVNATQQGVQAYKDNLAEQRNAAAEAAKQAVPAAKPSKRPSVSGKKVSASGNRVDHTSANIAVTA